MNAAMHMFAANAARDFLAALAGNAELVAQGVVPNVAEAATTACDAAEALVREMEVRGWVQK
jgi:hypothetical protein